MAGAAAGGDGGQREFWSGGPGRAWARRSPSVDRMLAGITDAIVEAAGASGARRALDLGCGAGGLALALARRMEGGAVAALDISEPLASVARRRARGAGAGIGLVVADAARPPLGDGVFDLLVSRLGAMFFADPVEAFRALRRSLAPGARVVLGVWRGPGDNPWAMVPVSAARPHLDVPPRPGPDEPGPFSFADPGRVGRILAAAGFEAPGFRALDLRMPVGGGVPEAVRLLVEVGPLAGPYRAAGAAARRRARGALAEALGAHLRGGTVELGGGCWIVTTAAPAGPAGPAGRRAVRRR